MFHAFWSSTPEALSLLTHRTAAESISTAFQWKISEMRSVACATNPIRSLPKWRLINGSISIMLQAKDSASQRNYVRIVWTLCLLTFPLQALCIIEILHTFPTASDEWLIMKTFACAIARRFRHSSTRYIELCILDLTRDRALSIDVFHVTSEQLIKHFFLHRERETKKSRDLLLTPSANKRSEEKLFSHTRGLISEKCQMIADLRRTGMETREAKGKEISRGVGSWAQLAI